VELTDGNEGKKMGGGESEAARDRTAKKTKALSICACKGKANWYALVMVTKKTERKYELTIWRSNFEVMRERSFASRAT
jgi:hypothetical protein